MPANVETMAYRFEKKNDVPWHGIGFPIDHNADPDEMLVASGLDWTVSKRGLRTFQEGNYKATDATTLDVKDYYVLVRDSDNKVLGPAGKEYTPIQNKQAFDFFKKFTSAGHMSMETAGSLQGGRQVWVLAKIKKLFTLPGGDEVQAYLLLGSPHIWGKSLVIKFTVIRVVCANTYLMSMNDSSIGKGFRMPHIRAFDDEVAKEAEISAGIATELFEGFEQTANKLVKARIDDESAIRFVADIMQPEMITEQFGKGFYKQSEAKQAELIVSPNSPKIDPTQFKRAAYEAFNSINKQPGSDMDSARGTAWGCFNAITYYIDHTAGRDRDNALFASWFGPKSATKACALRRAVQISEVLA